MATANLRLETSWVVCQQSTMLSTAIFGEKGLFGSASCFSFSPDLTSLQPPASPEEESARKRHFARLLSFLILKSLAFFLF